MREASCARIGRTTVALAILTGASDAVSEEAPPTSTDSRQGVHYGAALTLGSVGDPHRSGPWVEGGAPIDIGLSRIAYVGIEPAVAWSSFSREARTDISGLAIHPTEHNWQLGFLVRGTLGVDLAPWITVRAGPVLGVTSAHLRSEVCSGSVTKFVTGATLVSEVRFGPERRIAAGPQADFVWMRSPYCVYPNYRDTQTPALFPLNKPVINLLLHASLRF